MEQIEKESSPEILPDPYAVYNARAAIADQALLKKANEGMDALMVFAGLFSAVIATLIQITWSMLVPSASDYTNQVLLSIYAATVHEATIYPAPPEFHPENVAVVINLLFFLSLVLSLGTALGAMLVKEWARQYDPAAGYENISWLKARDRHGRYEGYTKWPLRTIHTLLPMILHAALLLFLTGVIVWTSQLHYRIYFTILLTVGLGTTGYLSLACIPAFVPDSPFLWPLSKAIRALANLARRWLKRLRTSTSSELQPEPSYIASPSGTSRDRIKVTQTRPTSYTTLDAAVLIHLLCNSSVHQELEAAMEALMDGEWASSSISQDLVKHERAIFQRYRDLEASCWKIRPTGPYDPINSRTRRLLRFLEWYYYQLTAEQRREVSGWPTVDLAAKAAEYSLKRKHLDDIVLTESALSKLHHVHLPMGTRCTFCIVPDKVKARYYALGEALERRDGTLPVRYYQNVISACVWSDTDCALYYAQAGGREGWKTLAERTLRSCKALFAMIEDDVPRETRAELYPLLRSLIEQEMRLLEPSDHRRMWLEGLMRVMKIQPPFPRNAVPHEIGVDIKPTVPLSSPLSYDKPAPASPEGVAKH